MVSPLWAVFHSFLIFVSLCKIFLLQHTFYNITDVSLLPLIVIITAAAAAAAAAVIVGIVVVVIVVVVIVIVAVGEV